MAFPAVKDLAVTILHRHERGPGETRVRRARHLLQSLPPTPRPHTGGGCGPGRGQQGEEGSGAGRGGATGAGRGTGV